MPNASAYALLVIDKAESGLFEIRLSAILRFRDIVKVSCFAATATL